MKVRRGPVIQEASIVILVEDCTTLGKEAMKAALDDARQHATRMADLLEMSLGRVIAVFENGLPSSAGFLVNSPSKVEIAIMLKTTFALEP